MFDELVEKNVYDSRTEITVTVSLFTFRDRRRWSRCKVESSTRT